MDPCNAGIKYINKYINMFFPSSSYLLYLCTSVELGVSKAVLQNVLLTPNEHLYLQFQL